MLVHPTILEDVTRSEVVIEQPVVDGDTPPPIVGRVFGAKSLSVNYAKAMITTEYEAEEYAAALKAAVIAEPDKGNRIQV